MAACAIANVPIVEVEDPTIHLRGRHFCGFVDHSRQNLRIVYAGVPQLKREFMISADAFGQHIHSWLGDAVADLGDDSIVSHSLNVFLRAQPAQLTNTLRASPGLARFRTFFRSRGGS